MFGGTFPEQKKKQKDHSVKNKPQPIRQQMVDPFGQVSAGPKGQQDGRVHDQVEELHRIPIILFFEKENVGKNAGEGEIKIIQADQPNQIFGILRQAVARAQEPFKKLKNIRKDEIQVRSLIK